MAVPAALGCTPVHPRVLTCIWTSLVMALGLVRDSSSLSTSYRAVRSTNQPQCASILGVCCNENVFGV